MCANNCNPTDRALTLPSSDGPTSLNFKFGVTGTTTDYSKLELFENGFSCCQTIGGIGGTEIGISVDGSGVNSRLIISGSLPNRLITVNIPTPLHNPKVRIWKKNQIASDGRVVTNVYFIGIDDVRGNFDDCYYKFLLNGNNMGVNISFQNGQLVVKGGF
jgi:hypothetical protein